MQTLKFTAPSVQPPPPHLQAAGQSLWTSTLAEWQLSDADLVVLATAAACADRLQQIWEIIDRDGPLITDPSERVRSHPLLAAEAQCHGLLLRAWKQLNLTDEQPPKIGRPPKAR